MAVAAIIQRKPQAEESERAPAPVISATARSPVMPSRISAPARSSVLTATSVQAKRFVSSPDDAAEREADRVAEQVMAMPTPARASSVGRAAPAIMRSPLIAQRAAAPARAAPRPASAAAATDANIAAEVKAAASGGFALSPKTKAFLQPRFRADFSGVRLHTDATAKRLSNKIGARAFTYGSHIFFNDGQYNPDSKSGLQLLAHELTHTIQQSETIQRKAAEPEVPRVNERTGKQASRLGISDALDYFADAANAIPGYRMFTILIGVNPINMSSVEASAANILRAIVEFLPGGNIITRVLDSYGVFEKVGSWIEGQLKSLGISGASIKAAINEFLDSLGWRDIFDLGGVWNRAKRIFTTPISRIISFAQSLFVQILKFVQEAVLRPLAALAQNTPFYPLLKAVLGKDPVTGEPVKGGAAEVIGGFMTMIGQEELWGNIQRANAIPRAWAWFQTALSGLVGLVTSIPTRFIDGLKSLEIMDFVVLPRAFVKIGGVLGSFLADFGRWALGTVFDLLKIIIEVVAPGVMPYIQRAAGAFQTIVRNPVRFIQTLVRAAMQGFRQFASNFLTHLQASLVGWLTGAMGGTGVYIPRGFNLREILKFVLSILGLTWANIRAKLVRATNEATVVALETGFDIVRTLVTEGPAAAWEKILEAVGNLRQMAIDAIMDFVKSRVVEAAVTRLLSMLSPAGAFIQAIIAIYNTVMFFVERLRQIAQVAASFIDAIATIAAGNIGPAANRVETTMAGLLTLVISFLARIAGLGRVADAVTGLIARIRAPIDRGLDRVVAWIVAQARRLGRFILQAGTPADPNARLQQGLQVATTAVNAMRGSRITAVLIRPVLAAIRVRYGFQTLEPVEQDGVWWVEGHINPRSRARTRQQSRVSGLTPQQLGALLEPILQRVERQWLHELAGTASASSRAGVARAEASIAAGGAVNRSGVSTGRTTLSPVVSREAEVALLRRVRSGVVPVGEHGTGMRAEMAFSGGEAPGGFTYLNDPANLGSLYVVGGGDYNSSIPPHVVQIARDIRRRREAAVRADVGVAIGATPTPAQQTTIEARINSEILASLSRSRQRLTRSVEPARSPGMLVARRAGEELVASGHATPAEVTHGDLNPMAFRGASGAEMNNAANMAERHRRIGELIQRLRDTAQRSTILAEPSGPEMRRIGDSIENWLRSNQRATAPGADPRDMISANRRLVEAFMQFLRTFQGGR